MSSYSIPFIEVKNNIVLEYVRHGDRFYSKDSEVYSSENNYEVTETIKEGFKLMNRLGHTLTVTYNQLHKGNWLVCQLPFWLRKNLGYK